MAKTREFYATRSDVLGLCEAIEQVRAVKYVEAGTFPVSERVAYHRAIDIPNIGVAASGVMLMEKGYLVMDQSTELVQELVRGLDGRGRILIYQDKNPDSVDFRPAGVHDGCIIQGTMGTISRTEIAQGLYELFMLELKKQFTKVGSTYLGPEALSVYEAGGRLTQSVGAPPECDFQRSRKG